MENVFNIRYNTELDRLQVEKESNIKKIIKFINTHKIFSLACTSLIFFSIVNFYLIYNFVKVLESI